jgi:hypothetical protein
MTNTSDNARTAAPGTGEQRQTAATGNTAAGNMAASSGRRPAGRRIQARVFRIINVPMRMVLGLPFATPLGGRLMLAYITGRTSGKLYRQPLSYVRDGDVLLTPGGGNWKLNLRPDLPVRLRVRGQDLMATPEVVADVDGVGTQLARLAAANPQAAGFTGIAREQDGTFDQAGLETAVRYGFRIVRWHLAG